MSDYLVKGESLTSLAEAIRTKTRSTEPMVFPDGFEEAVSGISAVAEIDELVKLVGQDRAAAIHSHEEPTWDTHSGGIRIGNFAGTCNNLFASCFSIKEPPLFDTSKIYDMTSMFSGCKSLTSVPPYDTSNASRMAYMFQGCESLTNIPLFDTSNVTSMSYMFYNCHSLTTVPLLDMSKNSDTTSMFYYCYSLTTVPPLDLRNIPNVSNMFTNCRSLTECWLRNIKTNLQIGSGTSYGHLLTVESLLHLIKECRDTGSTKTLTIGTANLEKLANTYVKLVDITDEMRAEDDLIDEKLPFEVCESIDEGAMLITEYVIEKNWQLK